MCAGIHVGVFHRGLCALKRIQGHDITKVHRKHKRRFLIYTEHLKLVDTQKQKPLGCSVKPLLVRGILQKWGSPLWSQPEWIHHCSASVETSEIMCVRAQMSVKELRARWTQRVTGLCFLVMFVSFNSRGMSVYILLSRQHTQYIYSALNRICLLCSPVWFERSQGSYRRGEDGLMERRYYWGQSVSIEIIQWWENARLQHR